MPKKIHPIVKSFKAAISDKGITLSDAVKEIQTHFIPEAREDKNFYNRIYRLTTGEFKEPTTEEAKAMQAITHTLNNYAVYAATLSKIPNIDRKLSALEKAINSGIYNRQSTIDIIKQLKPLSNLNG